MYSVMIRSTECQDKRSTLKIPPSCEDVHFVWCIHSVVIYIISLSWPATRWLAYLLCSDRFQFFTFISYQSPQDFIRPQRHAKMSWGEKSQRNKGLPNNFIKRKTRTLKSWGLFELSTPITPSSLQNQWHTVCHPPMRKAGGRINTLIFPSILIVHMVSHYN